jgi:hypothetical protein
MDAERSFCMRMYMYATISDTEKVLIKLKNQPGISFASGVELCCSFGLRLATIDSFEKFDCMVKNRIREFPKNKLTELRK